MNLHAAKYNKVAINASTPLQKLGMLFDRIAFECMQAKQAHCERQFENRYVYTQKAVEKLTKLSLILPQVEEGSDVTELIKILMSIGVRLNDIIIRDMDASEYDKVLETVYYIKDLAMSIQDVEQIPTDQEKELDEPKVALSC